jgi:hypothetical protein
MQNLGRKHQLVLALAVVVILAGLGIYTSPKPVSLDVVLALIFLALCAETFSPRRARRDSFPNILPAVISAIFVVSGAFYAFSVCVIAFLFADLIHGRFDCPKHKLLERLIPVSFVAFSASAGIVTAKFFGEQIIHTRQFVFASILFLIGWFGFRIGIALLSNRVRRGEPLHWQMVISDIAVCVFVGTLLTDLFVKNYVLHSFVLIPALISFYVFALSSRKLHNDHTNILIALTRMFQRTHPYTHGHMHRVAELGRKTALALGVSYTRAQRVSEAAIIHDLGKIAVDERILEKPGKLSTEEYEHVKLHSVLGAEILESSRNYKPIAKWVKHHHERIDGNGYPSKLKNEQIPLESKIIAVVDAFDAMVGGSELNEKRPYAARKTQSEAIEELNRCSGTQFDKKVVKIFASIVQRENKT